MTSTTLQYEYSDDTRVDNLVEGRPEDPAIAALPEGAGYVTVWQTYGADEAPEIHYKRIGANGTTNGAEIVVAQNGTTDGMPAIAVTQEFAAITYVVGTDMGSELHLKLIDVSSGQLSDDWLVAESVKEGESPAITRLNDGNFVIGWTGTDGHIHTAEYDYNGKLYANSDVRIDVPEGATSPSITAVADSGAYVVSYGTTEGNLSAVMVEPVLVEDASSGQKMYENAILTMPTGIVTDKSAGIEGMVSASVATLADGTYVVTWFAPNMVEEAGSGIQGGDNALEEEGATSLVEDGFNVYLQHLDKNARLVGEPEKVNTVTGNYNLDPHVTALGDGGYVVVWRSDSGDGDIVARRYDAQGHAVDNTEFTLNHDQAGFQTAPAVAAQWAGTGFATVWADEGHDDDWGGSVPPAIEVSVEYNQVPVFNNDKTETDVVSGTEINLNSLLTVNDADFNQHLQWSVADEPLNGTLTFTDAEASSGSQPGIIPGGSIIYKPAPGFVGTDAFTVMVYDGHNRAERTITVNVTAPVQGTDPNTGGGSGGNGGGSGDGNVAPGTPELAADYDSGIEDGITSYNAVKYSGSAGTMAGSQMTDTKVYVDVNGNGQRDEGEPGTFADNVDGKWTGSFDIGSVAEGTYTVYAENNWAGGEEYRSQTTLKIDRSGPVVQEMGAPDFDVSSGTMKITVTYSDLGSGIDPLTVNGNNLFIWKPNAGVIVFAEVQDISGNTVTYTAAPPGGWSSAYAGSYKFEVIHGVRGVQDLAGNWIAGPNEVSQPVEATHNAGETGNTGGTIPGTPQAPVLGGEFAHNTIDDRHTTKPFSGVTVSDADSAQVSIHIVYAGANGSLSGDGLEGEAGDYFLDAPDLATLQQRLQDLVFTPAAVQAGAAQPEVHTSFTLTPHDSDGPGLGNSMTEVVVMAAVPTQPTTPTTPTTPTQPADPVTHGTVDGVAVDTSTATGANGTVNNVTVVPVIVTSRVEDPATAHATLADIPLGVSGADGVKVELTVSLPTGAGLHAESANTLLSNQQALLDLIARIEDKTASGSDVQTRMTGQGGDFLGKLDQAVLLQTATLTPTLDANAATKSILINGSSVSHADGSGNASAIGLVIDASHLPSAAVLELNNVDFAAIVGDATLRGGDGRNYVVGDDAAQNILLGADDDVLAGGGGNDVVGSAGGNDTLDGGSGEDIVVGGIGNDSLSGGTGNDVLQGGRSDQGAWKFTVGADGTLSANHELAVFAPGTSENVATSELDLSQSGLSFANVASARLVDLALVYDAVLGRAPDLPGINFWADNPVDVKDVAAYMIESSEWMSSGSAALSDTEFVQKIYTHALGRAADDAGLAFWVGKLDASAGAPALTRAGVLTAIAFSDEHRAHLAGDDGIVTVGSGALGAETGWFGNSGDDVLDGGAGNDLLVGGNGIDTVVYGGALDGYKVVLGSAGQVQIEDGANGDLDTIGGIEAGSFADGKVDLSFTQASAAQLETLGMLYHAVLHRSADLDGMNWWTSRDLDTAGLVNGIINSDEYRATYANLDDAGFVEALYQAAGLDADAAGGAASWQDYLATHTRAELIGAWVSNDAVIDAQQGANGLWLV